MRVNIEEKLWSDVRFVKLGNLLKSDKYRAIGVFSYVVFLAQKQLSDVFDQKVLDLSVGIKRFSSLAVDAGLFENLENGLIRVKGAKERIDEIKSISVRQSNNAKKRFSDDATGIPTGKPLAVPKESQWVATGKPTRATRSMSSSMSSSKEENTKKEDPILPSAVPAPELSEFEFPKNEWAHRPDQAVMLVPETKSKGGDSMGGVMVGSGTDTKIESSIKKEPPKRRSATSVKPAEGGKSPPWSSEVYDLWRDCYKKAYNAEPPTWSQAEWGAIGRIHGRCGKDVEVTKAMIRHYFTRREYRFTNSGHSILELQPAFGRLWAELQNKIKITPHQMKRAERIEGTQEEVKQAAVLVKTNDKSIMDELDEYLESGRSEEGFLNQRARSTLVDNSPQRGNTKSVGEGDTRLLREGPPAR